MQSKFLAAASLLALGTMAIDATAIAEGEGKSDKEKCYGVAKAGKNHCAASDASHSCAGYSKADGATNEWVYLPKGTCELLVNGSLSGKK